MAETFKSLTVDAGTAMADLIPTVAAGTTVIVLSCRATNIHATLDATVSTEVTDGSSKNGYIAFALPVPNTSSVELAGNSKIVLQTGDKLQGLADAASKIEYVISYLEMT
jgi:hypothetical protein